MSDPQEPTAAEAAPKAEVVDGGDAAAFSAKTDEAFDRLKGKNYYERLEIPETADKAAILKAAEEMGKRFDPEQSAPELRDAVEQCKELIDNAINILTDEQEKAHYDNWLQGKNEDGEDAHVLIKEGELTKAGGSKKLGVKTSWKKRWFTLTTNALAYYTKQGGDLKGGILLETVTSCRLATSSECKNLIHKHGFSIDTKEGRVYTISCHSDEERDEWIRIVTDTCKLLSYNAFGEETGSKRLTASSGHKVVTGAAVSQAKDMSESDGADYADDMIVTGPMSEAMAALEKLVDDDKAANPASKIWELRGLHLGEGLCAGKTFGDVLQSFLRWVQKPDDVISEKFNVSKAFRRAQAFAEWQEDHADKYLQKPIDTSDPEFVAMSEMLPTTIPDYELGPESQGLEGAVPMFVSLKNGKVGKKQAKHSDEAIMRFMFGTLLPLMFDPPCQVKGIVIVEEVTGVSFFDMVSINGAIKPVEPLVSKLFYKCIPVKIKALIVTIPPWWMSALFGMVRLFLNKKQSERLHAASLEGLYELVGNANAIPSGFMGGKGTREYKARYA